MYVKNNPIGLRFMNIKLMTKDQMKLVQNKDIFLYIAI